MQIVTLPAGQQPGGHETATEAVAFAGTQWADETYRLASDHRRGAYDQVPFMLHTSHIFKIIITAGDQ